MYDQPGVDSTTVINQNGEFMQDLNAPGTIEQGLVGGFVKMPLYDVGMSALLVSEAQSLAELALVLGRNDTAAMLTTRCEGMRALMQQHLWHEKLGIYSNKFSGNSSFYPRISPTSFFPMFARSPTDDQAKRMIKEWLTSPTRFCVSPTGDMKGNNQMCWWGLPSISADDGAGVLKNDLGYWRGFVWGPLSILTFWSLQEYDHVPEVQHGRKMMVDQLSTMMARVWHSHRHIVSAAFLFCGAHQTVNSF
jgi:putative isomerase